MQIAHVVDPLNAIFESFGGPVLVVLFYWFRFHTMKGTRSFTTRPLFLFGLAVFITPFLVIYAVLPDKLSPLASVWLLMFVWLIPVAPKAWRKFCQELAGIPVAALALREALAAAPFQVGPDDMPSLQRKLSRVGYQIDDFRATQSTAIQSRFLKISALMLHLERWACEHEGFMERNSDLYAELLAVYDALCFRTVRVLKSSTEIYGAIMEDSHVEPDDWQALDKLSTRHTVVSQLQLAAQTAAGCMLEDLRKDMDALLNNLLLFAARAALAGEWTFARSRQRLGAIGFTLEPAPPGIAKFVAVAAGFGFVWCLAWLLGSGKIVHMPGDQDVGMMRTLLMTPLYLIVNFWLVYYFKRQYAFANETIFGRLPVGFILTVGLWGALILFPVQAAFDFYQFPQRPYLDVVLHELPILIFPWGIAAMAALLVQDSTWGKRSRKTRRMRDGLVFGGGMTVLLWVLLAIHRLSPMPVMEVVDNVSGWTFVWSFVLPTFGFGFTIGYAFMAWLREAASRVPVKRPVMATTSLASA
ncbi:MULTISPECIES: hypothetical protein [unclassified Bradyrhizobium]|uniref:hypothetical protein n=1 Tax=unclassified Bradyrhizobium TaxID=2631580 RepID=UPI0023058AB0|nr:MULTISPECIES: hypothetical protein [unclassified Bradyrhizobium]MDA9407113.1 hypothetical protein [Bradyrhizobium sp. CCBAU 45384]MDA9441736.1 hypothetical protein [Bradyrhizobium sp. CCBAU 51745]